MPASNNNHGLKKTWLLCAAILLAGVVALFIIFNTEPTAQREGAVKETAMLVEVAGVEHGTFTPTLTAQGTVVPSKDVVLSAQVEGEVIEIGEGFTPGGYVRQGDTLLRLDPADYKIDLLQRTSELQQAMADLRLEQGRRNVAEKEYELLQQELQEGMQSLVLREPQLESVRARVDSAEAAVLQAELELSRAHLTAPFDAHVLTRNVNVGSQVAPGENLGRLVGLNTYWVEATVPLSKLRRLRFAEDAKTKGSPVRIRNRTAWTPDEFREGRLFHLIGALEAQTRMARVLITVDDPMARSETRQGQPPLLIGSYVEVLIEAEPIEDVIRLQRDYLRQDDTVWVMQEGQLAIKEVQVLFRDAGYAYITEGIDQNARVVTTNLSTVTEGAKLRLQGDASGGNARTE